MQTINAQAAAMLQTAIRAPRAYVWVQLPVIVNQYGNIDAQKLGSQLVLTQLTSVRLNSVLDTGADTLDFELQGMTQDYSPLNNASKYGRYFAVGAVDIKYQLYLGIAKDGASTVWPKGVFVSESINQDVTDGLAKFQVNCLDQFSLFRGDAYTSFPPRLYGSQTSAYYNPNYALTNDLGDNKTFASDTMYWLSSSGQFPIWQSDYVDVAVYVSNVNGGTTAVPNSGATAYTIDYAKGRITFSTAQAAGVTVSVDARPIAMKPEVALYHLFVDFGSWDPNFIKFDQTGISIPLTEIGRDRPLMDIAKDIVALTAPRGQKWSLWIDELGYLRFSELAPDGPPVTTLYDTRDILHLTPEYSVKDLKNVVRASSVLANSQPVIADSYDVYSISTYGQKPTFEVPSQYTATVHTMDVGSAMSYLNNLANSLLFEYCRPSLVSDIKILPNPVLQIGDPINIVESKTGINSRFIIKQITNEIKGDEWSQTLRVERQVLSQDWNFGIAANLGVGLSTNPNAIQAQSGYLTDVSLNNSGGSVIHVVSNGQPLTDSAFQPYIFNWDGSALGISITIGNLPANTTAYIWRWMYIAEDAYYNGIPLTGDGTSAFGTTPIPGTLAQRLADLLGVSTSKTTLPYSVRQNIDDPIARRYWWPLLRCSDWLSIDGVTGYGTTSTLTSTWSNGPGIPSGNYTVYGDLVVGKNDYFGDQSSGFIGQQLYASGSPAATALGSSSTIKYGVDFGSGYTSSPVYYGIKNKQTPCYLNILVATTAGTMQFKKIAFMLSV